MQLTGLPEYRNGGLLLDLGVIAPLDADFLRRSHAVDDEAIVEWRALTVIALDRIAVAGARDPRRHGAGRFRSPACSKAAPGRRAGASPPSAAKAAARRCTIASDGTVF